MLTQLTIRNFTLIEHLEVMLDQGMTVISGETGAGKSILLDALGLALGDRADSGMIRHGCDKADISAHFDISQLLQAQAWLAEQDLELGHDCLLRRVVSSSGRSRAYINGHPVPLQNLRLLGEQLIDIHGQHEHQKLLKKTYHRQQLDAFGNHDELLQSTAVAFQHWHGLQKKLEQIEQQSEEQRAEVQLLQYQLQELQQLEPRDGELAELEQEQKQLASAEDIIKAGETARFLLSENDDGSCQSLVHQALQQLSGFDLQNERWTGIQEMLTNAAIQIEEASGELEHYVSALDLDPQRLQWLDERLSAYYQVARKHMVEAEQLPQLQLELSEKLAQMEISDEDIEQLRAECQQAETTYLKTANTLSQQRQQAAGTLQQAVNQQLAQLGMPDARFVCELTTASASARGLDDIEFLISTNPGQPAKPLHKIASGGELSRISLAIQVITAKTSATPVMAFDEVDVGIGGAIAEVVGQLLRELGEHSQILCVTHQPQVASKGHHHLRVSKHKESDTSVSAITRLDADQRINEVARMLGGIDITQRSLDHAEEMLALH